MTLIWTAIRGRHGRPSRSRGGARSHDIARLSSSIDAQASPLPLHPCRRRRQTARADARTGRGVEARCEATWEMETSWDRGDRRRSPPTPIMARTRRRTSTQRELAVLSPDPTAVTVAVSHATDGTSRNGGVQDRHDLQPGTSADGFQRTGDRGASPLAILRQGLACSPGSQERLSPCGTAGGPSRSGTCPISRLGSGPSRFLAPAGALFLTTRRLALRGPPGRFSASCLLPAGRAACTSNGEVRLGWP